MFNTKELNNKMDIYKRTDNLDIIKEQCTCIDINQQKNEQYQKMNCIYCDCNKIFLLDTVNCKYCMKMFNFNEEKLNLIK